MSLQKRRKEKKRKLIQVVFLQADLWYKSTPPQITNPNKIMET